MGNRAKRLEGQLANKFRSDERTCTRSIKKEMDSKDLRVIKCHVVAFSSFSINPCSVSHRLVIVCLNIFLSLLTWNPSRDGPSLIGECIPLYRVQCIVDIKCIVLNSTGKWSCSLHHTAAAVRWSVIGCSVAGTFPSQEPSNSSL